MCVYIYIYICTHTHTYTCVYIQNDSGEKVIISGGHNFGLCDIKIWYEYCLIVNGYRERERERERELLESPDPLSLDL